MAYALWKGGSPEEMKLQYYNGQLYNVPTYPGAPPVNLLAQWGAKPLQLNSAPAAPAPTPAPQMNQLQPQFNKLTGQARDALYGGLLGYQAPALTSGGSNPQSFAAPQGGFRFPFGLLNQG